MRRSLLQCLILCAMDDKLGASVTEIARMIGLLRPSVSRAVHLLEAQGLICYGNEGWTITPAGGEELKDMIVEAEKVVAWHEKQARQWSKVVDYGS